MSRASPCYEGGQALDRCLLQTRRFEVFPAAVQTRGSGIPRVGSKPTAVKTQPFPAVCELKIFFHVCEVNYSPAVLGKAFLDSQVAALINYCISCFTYPNYLPVASTMAFLKIFFSCSFWLKIENMNMYVFKLKNVRIA